MGTETFRAFRVFSGYRVLIEFFPCPCGIFQSSPHISANEFWYLTMTIEISTAEWWTTRIINSPKFAPKNNRNQKHSNQVV